MSDCSTQGCCQSTARPRDEEPNSPYSASDIHGDTSSNTITGSTRHAPEVSSQSNSSHAARGPQQSRIRRNVGLREQLNAPLRPHVWTSKRQWTRAELDRERAEFFDTRVTGREEIWATLKVVVGLLAEGDIATAQGILDASAITLPTGDLMNGAYDQIGNFYQMPEHVINDPSNVILASQDGADKVEDPGDATDEEELERRREEKGKSVLKTGEVVRVKARLSDRGGPDIVVSIGKEQSVRVLIKTIQEEANVGSILLLI